MIATFSGLRTIGARAAMAESDSQPAIYATSYDGWGGAVLAVSASSSSARHYPNVMSDNTSDSI